jgi:mannose/cellobiose epimerase-like protein (N-acyl-D-glucosamine 2-epimerase family)
MTTPDFKSPAFIEQHIARTMAFYHPHCIDPSGGFYQFFKDNGTVYDRHTRHLVSSTRYVFTYAMAYRRFRKPAYLDGVRHGVRFLRQAHRNPATGGYAWLLDWRDGAGTVRDGDNHCYGLAFVLLAYAHALMAGMVEARAWIEETVQLMEQRFWEPEAGLYADQASEDWSARDAYRGQNANMHACEALIAAFDATGHQPYLQRAETLARHITVRQAARAGGRIWEHYKQDWSVDWDYNLHDKSNLFRPWGFQPGHFTEWSKLLLLLEQRGAATFGGNWLLTRAEALFDSALHHAWDDHRGGIHYGFAPDGKVCDADKYHWVQAESLAAAAMLARRTGRIEYFK